MSSLKEEDLKKILPENGPPKEEVYKYIEKYKNDLIVIKYGGNVFIDRQIFDNFITDLTILNKLGLSIVVVHGGGPRMKRELDKASIESKFIRGLRVTDEKIINIVESVLIEFNEDIVSSEGVLDKNKKLIEEISSSEILEMIKNETITGGMIPKINTCLDAINNGVTAVGIIDARPKHSILFELFSDKGSGTLIRK